MSKNPVEKFVKPGTEKPPKKEADDLRAWLRAAGFTAGDVADLTDAKPRVTLADDLRGKCKRLRKAK